LGNWQNRQDGRARPESRESYHQDRELFPSGELVERSFGAVKPFGTKTRIVKGNYKRD
jgi:hypothetical protein